MEIKVIKLRNKKINCLVKTSYRAKYIRLSVYLDGRVVITRPFFVQEEEALKFLKTKTDWILKKCNSTTKNDYQEYIKYKKAAYNLVKKRLDFFNKIYNFKFNRIFIKNQKTRWGSCSHLGNLNFNYRIVFLSPDLRDYIVVHELCHLKEFNHSADFWNLVKITIPEYKQLRRKLKSVHLF